VTISLVRGSNRRNFCWPSRLFIKRFALRGVLAKMHILWSWVSTRDLRKGTTSPKCGGMPTPRKLNTRKARPSLSTSSQRPAELPDRDPDPLAGEAVSRENFCVRRCGASAPRRNSASHRICHSARWPQHLRKTGRTADGRRRHVTHVN
jgi:hypothetical protein